QARQQPARDGAVIVGDVALGAGRAVEYDAVGMGDARVVRGRLAFHRPLPGPGQPPRGRDGRAPATNRTGGGACRDGASKQGLRVRMRGPMAQPALRLVLFFVALADFFADAFFFVAFFLPGFFASPFFAGVRLLLAMDFCSSDMKSTTLVAASSAGSGSFSSALASAPLDFIFFLITSSRRARNSSWNSSGAHSPDIDEISCLAMSISFAVTR